MDSLFCRYLTDFFLEEKMIMLDVALLCVIVEWCSTSKAELTVGAKTTPFVQEAATTPPQKKKVDVDKEEKQKMAEERNQEKEQERKKREQEKLLAKHPDPKMPKKPLDAFSAFAVHLNGSVKAHNAKNIVKHLAHKLNPIKKKFEQEAKKIWNELGEDRKALWHQRATLDKLIFDLEYKDYVKAGLRDSWLKKLENRPTPSPFAYFVASRKNNYSKLSFYLHNASLKPRDVAKEWNALSKDEKEKLKSKVTNDFGKWAAEIKKRSGVATVAN
ncbi:hypothetical protein RFI_28792 [Reticulomyxa filosa]|uniref:HMG box domain-containing protein n=1 Tax=Reticulomyxa filosa TaxID=46433 RepID=X6M6D8_RETFI|nr:hypothetical protein RFI_28792 [Reticulomyxa filosa]|eukprot:ETO08595.1 hypothetical protein RFI_28792 [Reticulomyxa filosa]